LLVVFVGIFYGVERVNRGNMMRAGIGHLALWIELYRADHHSYPSSLGVLSAGGSIGSNEIQEILHDRFYDKYEYQPQTNGFVITATGEGLLFYNRDVITKEYKIGEALKLPP